MGSTAELYSLTGRIRSKRSRRETAIRPGSSITLEQMRIFSIVSELENMTLAARALGLTQSGVSGAISSLEERCGLSLFDRVGRSIRLTDAGRVFATETSSVLARVSAAEQALEEFKQIKRGTLQILASHTVANYWLPIRLVEYRRRHPKVKVLTKIDNTASVVRGVLDGAAPIGFIEGEACEPALQQNIVGIDDLVIVVGPQHPWAKKASLNSGDLSKGRWVLREQGSGTRSALEDALENFGIKADQLNVVLEIPSNHAICTAVEEGLGATALSSLVVKERVAAGRLIALPLKLPKRTFKMLVHRERKLSCLASSFADVAGSSVPALSFKSASRLASCAG